MLLVVWMNGKNVGAWSKRRGVDEFQYTDEWAYTEDSIPLSLSLPILPGNPPHKGKAVANFFGNLLPDNLEIRSRLVAIFKANSSSTFDLLAALGHDCAGAVQLLEEGRIPSNLQSLSYEVLGNEQVANIIRATTTSPRVAIAGEQEKTALLKYDGQWCKPLDSTPTTHILKPSMGSVGVFKGDMSKSVENEWLCSKIVAAFGLKVAHCEIEELNEQKVLAVERFDRKLVTSSDGNAWVERFHQEDLCQALGFPSRQKYQNEGGPCIASCMSVLSSSTTSRIDMVDFFKSQLIFWLLMAPDAHAKNFSIFHHSRGGYQMTPLYDILSASHLIGNKNSQIPYQNAKMAMAIRSSRNYYHFRKITRGRFIRQATQAGIPVCKAEGIIDETVESVEKVIAKVEAMLPVNFPEELASAIFTMMQSQAQKLQA